MFGIKDELNICQNERNTMERDPSIAIMTYKEDNRSADGT